MSTSLFIFLLSISNCLSLWSLIASNYSLFLHSIFFKLFKTPSFLSSSSNTSLETLPDGEYSNLNCLTIPGWYPKSSPVKYSNLPNSFDDNAEI